MFCTGTACTFAQFPPPSNTFMTRLSSPLPQACGTPSACPAAGVAQTGLAAGERGSGARQTPGGGRSPAHSPTEGTGRQHSGGWQGGGADSIPRLLGAPGGTAHLARRPPAHLEDLRQTPAAAWSGRTGASIGWRRLGVWLGRVGQSSTPPLVLLGLGVSTGHP